MPLLRMLVPGDLCLYRLFCQILPFTWTALVGLSSCRMMAMWGLANRSSNILNRWSGRNQRKNKDHSPWWMFLSRALFISRHSLGFVGNEVTRKFFTSSGITKNKSNTIHLIGKVNANHWILCTCANVHIIGVDGGLTDLINCSDYANSQQFYILSQQILLELLFEKYGVDRETKEATTDDKIWVAGIVFSELRKYIPDMLGSLRESKIRADLDAAAARKLAGICTMFTKFIDKKLSSRSQRSRPQRRRNVWLMYLLVKVYMSNTELLIQIMLHGLH